MPLKIVTPPSTYPVSLDEAKAHLRVDFSDDDTLIEIYRKAASEDAENFTGRAFYDQTWDYYLDQFPSDGSAIKIPKAPLIEVVGLFGNAVEVASDSYIVDRATEPGRISVVSGGAWPTLTKVANAVRLRFRAGYVDEDTSPVTGAVPFAIKAAILLMIGTLYENRETVVVGQIPTMMPWAAQQLLRPYRIWTVIG